MSDTLPGEPGTGEFLNASNWMYASNPVGNAPLPPYLDDLRPFDVNGQPVTEKIDNAGFYGAAFLTPSNQVIVAFEGTSPDQIIAGTPFGQAQLGADVAIYLGATPPAYVDALNFTATVENDAAAQQITGDNVFVTGHSLGAGEAEYVAARTGIGGVTFAAPGLPSYDIGNHSGDNLVDYIQRGDPVANYAADSGTLGNFLYDPSIAHYGQTHNIGSYLDNVPLYYANGLLGGDADERLAGLGVLAVATAVFHPIETYSASLGIPLTNPGPGIYDLGAALLTIEKILGLSGGQIGHAFQGGSDIGSAIAGVMASANAPLMNDLLPLQAASGGPSAPNLPATIMPGFALASAPTGVLPVADHSPGSAVQTMIGTVHG